MPERILVIDDDDDILEIFQMIFQEEGYQVILSNTAKAADHIHQINPNLIILDVRLDDSDKDGAEICREFKASYPNDKTPIILISAEFDIRIIAGDCNADAFMSKPFDIYKLLDKVKELIS